MSFEEIKKRYSYLSSAELEKELKERTTRACRTSTWMVGADGCMINAHVVRACREILEERREA